MSQSTLSESTLSKSTRSESTPSQSARGAALEVAALPHPSSPAQWDAWKNRELPPAEQLVSGVWCIPVVIPDHPMRFTFCYAITGNDGATVLVDPGWASDASWDSLRAGLQTAGIPLAAVVGVVVTHAHPDHHGLAGRVATETGGWIAMHTLEAESLLNLDSGADRQRHVVDALRYSGIPSHVVESLLDEVAESRNDLAELARAKPSILLEDGDLVDLPGTHIRIVWTPGHTPGSICLHDEIHDILFTGDHVLPRISPNVGMHPASERSPLSDYLRSLTRVAEFASAHVAPGHEYRFDDLAPRLASLAAHHQDRLDEILGAVAASPASSLWDIAATISWSRGWNAISGVMIFAALGETSAHLDFLAERGAISTTTDDNGITRFTAGSVTTHTSEEI